MLLLLLILLILMCYYENARDIAPVVFGAVLTTLVVLVVPLSLMLSWLHYLYRWSCCLWCLRGYTARDIGPAVFGIVMARYTATDVGPAVMATLLVMLVLQSLVLSGQHCSWSRCSNCWF